MTKFYIHIHLLLTALLPLYGIGLSAEESYDLAGGSSAQATEINDTVMLAVQDGGNYIKFDQSRLPATISYLPDTAFGPIPFVILNASDTLESTVVFEKCAQYWHWTVSGGDETSIINISSHENARILVEPRVCHANADTTAVEWDSFEWRGKKYTDSQDVPVVIQAEGGCEYTYTLHLTIHKTHLDTTSKAACEKVEWEGKTYTDDGVYRLDTVPLTNGDRQINFINVTIHKPTSSTQPISACESYTAPWGTVYTTSGVIDGKISNAAGCDSLMTINLTINKPTSSTQPISACDSYTAPWGTVYTTSGVIDGKISNAAGCDSLMTINLTIKKSTSSTQPISACESYTAPWGKTYTTSGVIEGRITNAAGCDSLMRIDLTILTDCGTEISVYDTVYFCPGLHKEYDEQVDDTLRSYLQYIYESPAMWDYMEGVIVAEEQSRTKMNLRLAEQNLRAHYVDKLMPIDNIVWTIRYEGEQTYELLEPANGPQWIEAGMLALQVQFRCGVVYNEQYPTDIVNTRAGECPAKKIENGQVFILRGGEKYNILGTKIY